MTEWSRGALPGGDPHGVPANERFRATGRWMTAPVGSRIQPRARGERPHLRVRSLPPRPNPNQWSPTAPCRVSAQPTRGLKGISDATH